MVRRVGSLNDTVWKKHSSVLTEHPINPHSLFKVYRTVTDLSEISSFIGTFVLNTECFREIPLASVHDDHPGNSWEVSNFRAG